MLLVLGLGDAITREDIKEVLATEFSVNIDKDGGDIAFITYEKGGAEAKVRKLLYSTILFKRDVTDIRPFFLFPIRSGQRSGKGRLSGLP